MEEEKYLEWISKEDARKILEEKKKEHRKEKHKENPNLSTNFLEYKHDVRRIYEEE